MGIAKLLTVLVLIGIGYLLYQKISRNTSGKTKKRKKQVNRFVSCNVCDLHIPEAEAISHKGRYYCSQAHLESDQDPE